MKIEEQLTCLDLSQQLRDAGYKQEGLWWWSEMPSGVGMITKNGKPWYKISYGSPHGQSQNGYVAPTVAELLRVRKITVTIHGSTRKPADFLAREWLDDKKKI